MSKDWLTHYHPDEHAFVDRAADWVRQAENHSVKRTDFLDPRQGEIVLALANRSSDVVVALNGGYEEAERKRAILAPDYRDPAEEPAGIVVLSITSDDAKLAELEHGDYMGAVLGLGIKREKIGDIHVLEQGCHILVTEEIAEFLRLHLQQVHRVHVQTELLPLEQLQTSPETLEEMSLSVASLRLDGILSDVFRLSRAKALVPIKAGRCRVNWKAEEDPSKPLKDGDVVSLKGFGRFRVLAVEGMTKKGRMRVKVGKYS
ncbi:RNA-binding protein S4 [Paenibacillus sp. J31TS4]|uniref:YlmH family RNA-binding protein n=1 Tax=Paenibacillus sp. J31TS4 TaxID=2807195 RepID=UPI001B06F920|nr:YlmH/Sll1252 family protein [Paenibacillus sp. J31TS4]GIP39693.1 RNA-binding protein S4 [Paenibacillus sp. J31TS4]